MERIRCPLCDSTQCYIRIKTDEVVCQSCGGISPKPLPAAK